MINFHAKYLILARHGTYEETTGEIDENGERTIRKVAKKLKMDYLSGLRLKLIYSPVQRTKQTAEIYAQVLEIPFERAQKENRLRGTKDDPNVTEEIKIEEATQAIEEALKSNEAEAYLLVTHEDTAIDSITLFRKRNFGIEQQIETMGFGNLFLMDLNDPKSFIRLRP
jgi:phosphohistidine phosphatase SixA